MSILSKIIVIYFKYKKSQNTFKMLGTLSNDLKIILNLIGGSINESKEIYGRYDVCTYASRCNMM